MPRICYVERKFSRDSLAKIDAANSIIAEYIDDGLSLTLRQLYYQFVSRDLIPNNQREYKNLGSIINDARMAGLIDWSAIEDRTRNLQRNAHWETPEDLMRDAASQYHEDLWEDQNYYVEVWIEKDALIGVVEGVCTTNDVPYFSCRGYTSQSEVWGAAMRLNRKARNGRQPVIIHLGDHDPSGIDMTRDITERVRMFASAEYSEPPEFDPEWKPCRPIIKRIALNMDQVEEYQPPPNPAKITDSRAAAYIDEHGNQSWELDALNPKTLIRLIDDAIDQFRDARKFAKRRKAMETNKKRIMAAAAKGLR